MADPLRKKKHRGTSLVRSHSSSELAVVPYIESYGNSEEKGY